VSKGEISLAGVNLFNLNILLGEKIKSELIFFLGSKAKPMSRNVLNKGLLDLIVGFHLAVEACHLA